jgi:chromosome segregation ATPase
MNEEPTRDLPNKLAFEERVFARFDSINTRFDTVDARLEKLEARAYDTKPIWQRALAAIMEMGLEVGEIKSKVGVIEGKVGVIEEKVDTIEGKVQLIENDIAVIKSDHKGIRNELVDVRREVKHNVKEQLALIFKLLLEDRDDIRDVEDKIRQLETKLA